MWKNRYWMAFLILLLTIAVVIVFWQFGGQNAVLTITAVVGLILAILRWLFPISPDQQSSPGSGSPGGGSFGSGRSSSSKRFSGGSFRKR